MFIKHELNIYHYLPTNVSIKCIIMFYNLISEISYYYKHHTIRIKKYKKCMKYNRPKTYEY